MKQLTQNLKSGKMALLETPLPALGPGSVLVRNHYSVISAGTEGKRVRTARSGYLAKAREKPEEVRKVLDSIRTRGLAPTYRTVMDRLDMPSPLGYSCAGEVIGVGREVSGLAAGDLVACGGSSAVHAEIVAVPRNLCVKVLPSVAMQQAAFATVGAIALQGIRQADLRLGENAVVIGLGLIGQLTVQLLEAGGIRPFGIDTDERQVELALSASACLAMQRDRPDLEKIIMEMTGGSGTDAVIITAGTTSLDPVELAGALCRKKGKVVVVGDVATGFSRENYYRKELDLRMSCSYGPGRYDPIYEEKGIDYPVSHVRWTENRNMQAFIELLNRKRLAMNKIITHVVPFEEALHAYDLILDKSEPYTGIVLKYDASKDIPEGKLFITPKKAGSRPSPLSIGFIGAGSFARNFLLPEARKYGNLTGVATARPNTARTIADRYGFGYCTGNADEIIGDSSINTVFIATRHNLHAEFVMKALQAGKNVYVEKPLCLSEGDLEEIADLHARTDAGEAAPKLMIGFNRRFAPHVLRIRELFPDTEPKAISCRINAGALPQDHWVHDPGIGGGRVVGEVCHFVDLVHCLAGARPTDVSAAFMADTRGPGDTLVINLEFENGSIGSISYFSNGSARLPKERIEVFCLGRSAVIDDFGQMTVYSKTASREKLPAQDKGHREGIRRFLMAVRDGLPSPVPFQDMYRSTLATFKVLESARNRKTIRL